MTDITTKTIVANIINTTPTIKASVISDTPTFKANVVLMGADGKEIELQVTATHIQWRLAGGTWADLIALADITGADGADGSDGNGIASITLTDGDHSAGTTDTYTIAFDDTTTTTFTVYNGTNGTNGIDGDDGLDGDDGNGIASITRTSGTGAAGTTDTYTITFDDLTTTTFDVYNGADGTNGIDGADGNGIASVVRTAGTGAAGTTDTYTITFTDTNTTTFNVYNGANGTGAGDMLTTTYDINGNGIVDNAEKVNGKTVEENVPSGAVFTDTVTTVNGNTGAIVKADITALGIPAQDTIYTHPNHSGDVTSVADGAQTIANGAVTLAKMADIATGSILGRVTTATGVPEVLTPTQVRTMLNVADGANAYVHPNHSGDVTSVADGAQTISNNVVNNAKLAQVAVNIIKGRKTAGTGNVEDLTVSDVLAMLSVYTQTETDNLLANKAPLSSPAFTGTPTINDYNFKSLKNAIINGGFQVNQRAVTGSVVLSAGVYGHDRWKAGASGCSYTFATIENVTTLTIGAGSLIQIIEGLKLETDTYCLSWEGTSQGKIGAGSYGNSGITGLVTGGTNINIEFGTGTLSKVRLNKGSVPIEYQAMPYADVLRECQRYYWRMNANQEGTYPIFGMGKGLTVDQLQILINMPVPMRAKITTLETSALNSIAYQVGATIESTPSSITLDSNATTRETVMILVNKTSSFTVGSYYILLGFDNTGAFIAFSAEL